MTAPSEAVLDAAGRLWSAYRDGPIAPVRGSLPDDIKVAYRVQDINTERALSTGRRLVGRKVGLTSVAVQSQFSVRQPDFGMLFNDMVVEEGGEVPAGRLLQPRVEAEVAFVLDCAVTEPPSSVADVIAAVAFVLPAIEIVDSRIAGWDISIVDTVADNASSGLFVLGTRPRSIKRLDLELCGMRLRVDGVDRSFGAGAACLGHPLNALAWLAATLVEVGRPLQAGDVVLSGALGPLVPVAPGQCVEAGIGGLGSVSVRFAHD